MDSASARMLVWARLTTKRINTIRRLSCILCLLYLRICIAFDIKYCRKRPLTSCRSPELNHYEPLANKAHSAIYKTRVICLPLVVLIKQSSLAFRDFNRRTFICRQSGDVVEDIKAACAGKFPRYLYTSIRSGCLEQRFPNCGTSGLEQLKDIAIDSMNSRIIYHCYQMID